MPDSTHVDLDKPFSWKIYRTERPSDQLQTSCQKLSGFGNLISLGGLDALSMLLWGFFPPPFVGLLPPRV
jgi:hypothetical protein